MGETMPNPTLAARILRRFLASQPETRSVVAGFVPDKFWRTQKAELRKLLLAEIPERDRKPREIDYKLLNELVPFFKKFKEAFLAFGMHRFAEESLANRVEYLINNIQSIAKTYDEYNAATYGPYPINTIEEQTIQRVVFAMQDVFSAKIKTLRDALKGTWKTDERLIKLLAQRLIKRAPPNVQEAFKEELKWKDSCPPNDIIDTVWKYYGSAGLDNAARKLITIDTKRSKLDPLAWIDMLQEVAANVFTKPEAFTEFDFHGVKVVVDDTTVDERDIQRYVRYIDHTYNLFKAKGVDKVWYGTFFIRCEDCGGVNQYGADLGVGGNYPVGPDVVNIFSRPGEFIVELLAHELGHRYWYKVMNEGQRGKFESLIKVEGSEKDPANHELSVRDVDDIAEAITKALKPIKPAISKFKEDYAADTTPDNNGNYDKAIGAAKRLDQTFSGLTGYGGNPIVQMVRDRFSGPARVRYHIDQEHDRRRELLKALIERYFQSTYDFSRFQWTGEWADFIKKKNEAEVFKNLAILDTKVDDIEADMAALVRELYKLVQESPHVKPVTEYGGKSISEAFAEVFAYYIIGKDMNRDQIESFRSVLSSTGLPEANRH